LLVFVVDLLLCLIYKLNFITDLHVQEKIEFSTICGIRYPMWVFLPDRGTLLSSNL
jgi:hypothetical protein